MNTAALTFALAELALAINVVVWPLAGNPWWTSIVALLAMLVTWPLAKYTQS